MRRRLEYQRCPPAPPSHPHPHRCRHLAPTRSPTTRSPVQPARRCCHHRIVGGCTGPVLLRSRQRNLLGIRRTAHLRDCSLVDTCSHDLAPHRLQCPDIAQKWRVTERTAKQCVSHPQRHCCSGVGHPGTRYRRNCTPSFPVRSCHGSSSSSSREEEEEVDAT